MDRETIETIQINAQTSERAVTRPEPLTTVDVGGFRKASTWVESCSFYSIRSHARCLGAIRSQKNQRVTCDGSLITAPIGEFVILLIIPNEELLHV